MKKIITLAIIGLIFTGCDFKANVIMPEQPKDEKEFIAHRHKIEMAEKEIVILETINESIAKEYEAKTVSKIDSKSAIEHWKLLDKLEPGEITWQMEIVKNSERIYELLSRIQMWNDAIYKFY